MKFLMGLVVFSFGVLAQAEVSGSLAVTSNYIWRGLSFSSGGARAATGSPVLQGTLTYAHPTGVALNAFVSNSDSTDFGTAKIEKDTEADLFFSYSKDLGNQSVLGFVGYWYNYIHNPSNNCFDYQIFWDWSWVRIDVSYIPRYLGIETPGSYAKLSGKWELDSKVNLIAHLGASTFGSESKVGFKNYVDHKLGVLLKSGATTFETSYTGTDRKDMSGKDLKDTAVTVTATLTY